MKRRRVRLLRTVLGEGNNIGRNFNLNRRLPSGVTRCLGNLVVNLFVTVDWFDLTLIIFKDLCLNKWLIYLNNTILLFPLSFYMSQNEIFLLILCFILKKYFFIFFIFYFKKY